MAKAKKNIEWHYDEDAFYEKIDEMKARIENKDDEPIHFKCNEKVERDLKRSFSLDMNRMGLVFQIDPMIIDKMILVRGERISIYENLIDCIRRVR